ncbi:hypothetical protein HKK72_36760, partial [Actinomadura sp. HBU206391]|nr:hypothetical protein [Actinomadura sp. HBU206391]
DVRRDRTLVRDGPHLAESWDRWSRCEEAHFAADGTRARADLHVDGTAPYEPGR